MIPALLVLLALALISGTIRLLWQMLPGIQEDSEDGTNG